MVRALFEKLGDSRILKDADDEKKIIIGKDISKILVVLGEQINISHLNLTLK
jgi:hypothetical protein